MSVTEAYFPGKRKRLPIPESAELPEELSIQELADMTGVRRQTIWRATEDGRLPHRQLRHGPKRTVRLIRADDARAFAESVRLREPRGGEG